MKRRAKPIGLFAVVALGIACVACDSGVRTPGGGGGDDGPRNIVLVDSGAGGADQAGLPRADTLLPTPDTTQQPQPDTFVPQPDTQPQQTGPQPPFGNSVGGTAANFTVPDCNDQDVTLHDYFNKGKAVIVMLNKGS